MVILGKFILKSYFFFGKCCLERNISRYIIYCIDKYTDIINYSSGVTEALLLNRVTHAHLNKRY